MTLGIALFAKDNTAIIASDKRITGGTTFMSTHGDFVEKIHKITDRCALTLAGDAGIGTSIIDLFLKKVKIELTTQGVQDIPIKEVAEIFRSVAVESYEKWFGQMSMKDWVENIKNQVIPFFRVLLVGFDKKDGGELKKGKILDLSSHNRFAPSEITINFAAIGVPNIAQYLLYRFYKEKQDEVATASLAAFCIQETSSQDGSVGEQFQIASFSDKKPFEFYSNIKIEEIKQRCNELKTELEIALFPSQRVEEKTSEGNQNTLSTTESSDPTAR